MTIDIINKCNEIDFDVTSECNLKLDIKRSMIISRKINVYDVKSLAKLHQIIGYAKYKYRNYTVLYRGVNELYQDVMPLAYRNQWDIHKQNEKWKN